MVYDVPQWSGNCLILQPYLSELSDSCLYCRFPELFPFLNLLGLLLKFLCKSFFHNLNISLTPLFACLIPAHHWPFSLDEVWMPLFCSCKNLCLPHSQFLPFFTIIMHFSCLFQYNIISSRAEMISFPFSWLPCYVSLEEEVLTGS